MAYNGRPVIAISGNIMSETSGNLAGYCRSFVNDDYVQAVIRAGGIPLIIPVAEDLEVIRSQADMADGFIFTGGVDIDPIRYSEEVLPLNGEINQRRDTFDFELMKIAMESDKPILGICRGMQLINVFNGGNLYQDLSYKEGTQIKHTQEKYPEAATHTVSFKSISKLYEIFGDSYRTNSFHHQSVKVTAKGFKIAAMTRDSVVEAIELDGERYILGVQWHPEMMAATDKKMHGLFVQFVKACFK